MKNFFSFFFRQTKKESSSSVKFEARTQHTLKQRTSSTLSNFIIIIMLRKGVNNSRSKLSLSVMKKDKSKNSTYILVNQVSSFHLRFCCVFFVFLSSLSSSRLMMMMRIGKATTGRVVLCSIYNSQQ